jgi:CBS-domain-containing membrane protein
MRTWKVDDVMTEAVVSVQETASYRSLVDLLVSRRFSAVPVVDETQRVTGVVSEADLLRKIEYSGAEEPRLFESRRRRGERAKARAATAAELMSTPPVVAPVGTPLATAARLMDAEQVKRLPVVDDQGRLVGIVTRGDLLKAHLRPDDEIHRDVTDGVLTPLLAEGAGKVTVTVTGGDVTLTGRVALGTIADNAVRLTRQVAGVVTVAGSLDFDVDDRYLAGRMPIYGVA